MFEARRHPESNEWVLPAIQFDNGRISFTAEVYEARLKNAPGAKTSERYLVSCGQCPEQTAAAFPELAEHLKWHLVSEEGPMHYLPNGAYWLKNALGLYRTWEGSPFEDPDPRAFEYFKKTVVWGACKVDGDVIWDDLTSLPLVPWEKDPRRVQARIIEDRVAIWGALRLPELLEEFHKVVEVLRR